MIDWSDRAKVRLTGSERVPFLDGLVTADLKILTPGMSVYALLLNEKSRVLGAHMLGRLRAIRSPALRGVRGRGLWAGAEIEPRVASAREACERLLAKGVLSKETHHTVVRLAPPLVIARADLDWALDRFEEVVHELEHAREPVAA